MTMKKRLLALLLALFLLCLTGCTAELVDFAKAVLSSAETTPEPSESPAPTLTPTPEPTPSPTPEPTPPPTPPPDEAFVKVIDYIPDTVIELRYATEDNFVGEVIYDFTDAWLRYGTVKKLMSAAEELAEMGYRFKIWDAFRPPAAQFVLWEKVPNGRYVSNPYNGYSKHSHGNTVDITIVDSDGRELEMPTGFDDFTLYADRDYSDVSATAAENSQLLEDVLVRAGFVPYSGEWWHFSDSDVYEPEHEFLPPAA